MPEGASALSAQEGKALFDAYRGEQTALARAIARRTEILTRRVEQAIGAPAALELVVFMSLLLGAWRQHHSLRDVIIAPVAALLRDIGRIRNGELVTTIDPSGPSELRQLGAGLSDMVNALATAKGAADSRDELVRAHADRLRQALDASREFYESLNLPYVVGSVRSHTMAVGGYDQVIVWLMSDDKKGLLDANAGQSTLTLTLEQSADHTLAWRAATSGRIAFEEADGRVRFGDPGERPVRARAIPLVVGARVVGALEARHLDARAASREAVEVLEMLAAHAATAIESARLNQVSEERSQMDALTQLHNRRRLDEDLNAECKRCVRYGRPLAFVMLDVDHFKAFNDAHGHPQADVVLQEVAAVISGSVRATDSAYRYGGEEFCILLRETDGPAAMQFAERLRQSLELRFANGITPSVTASFGVAEFAPDVQMPRALVEAADAAMYESKRAGRNRVMLSSRPPLAESGFSDSSGTIRISKIPA
jgi:diguanylate cyclase (GGDEF)-like protein